jgi:hypothetical protein
MEGSDGTCESNDDITTRVQIEEAKCAIRKLPFVTLLAPVRAVGDKAEGFRVTLSCTLCRWYDICGKGQEQAVQLSRERTTLLACLQELRKRLQDRHGFRCAEAVAKKATVDAVSAVTVNPDAPNVLDAMVQLEQARTREKPTTSLLWTRRRKRMLLNKKCKDCNSCYKPRELEHMPQLSMTMRSVIRSHRTTWTSLIIVVRLHAFKTAAQFLSALAEKFQLRRKARWAAGTFSPGTCGMDCVLESWQQCDCSQNHCRTHS